MTASIGRFGNPKRPGFESFLRLGVQTNLAGAATEPYQYGLDAGLD